MILKRIAEPKANTVGFWCSEGWTWPWDDGEYYCFNLKKAATRYRISKENTYIAPYELSSWRE